MSHGQTPMSAPLIRLRRNAERIRSSPFLRNVATVASGIVGAQLISLAFMPFLTRLYGPESFGVWAAFSAILTIFAPLSTFGYATAIVLPKEQEDATAVARLSLVCALIVVPFSLAVVSLFQAQLVDWAGLQATPGVLYLIPACLLLGALLSVANHMAIREGVFRAKSGAYVVSTLLTNLGKLGGGLFAPSGFLLVVFSLVATALNFMMLLVLVPREGVFCVRRWFGTKGIRRAAKEQRDFALYQMPQSIIRAASVGLPVIVLTSVFGAGTAGQYSVTVLLLSAPVMLLSESVGQVFFPKITRAIQSEPGRAGSLIGRATFVLALVGFIPFGAIAVFGGWAIPLVLGGEWTRAGEFSQWIALWMAFMLISRPAVSAMPALRMQSSLLIFEVVTTIARIAALYLGFKLGDDLTSVAAFSIVNVVGYLALLLVVLMKVGNKPRDASHA